MTIELDKAPLRTGAKPLDAATVRADFPILQRTMKGRPLIYLDSAATSQKPLSVLRALDRYYRQHNANVHRGVYELAEEATAAYEGARAKVAGFIGASSEETIFVRNATEAINLVARTWGQANIRAGDIVVLTVLEHHSNLVPWHILAAQSGAELRFIGLRSDGTLNLDDLDAYLATGRVKLVSTTFISNVLGTVAPVKEIAARTHGAGALYLVDGAQAVPHFPMDVRALDVDFLACTGHKMLGPMGIGVLYGRRSILETMPPFLGGGEMIRRVRLEGSTWNELPWKFEAGTPSVGDAVALGAAVDYLQSIGMESIHQHDGALTAYALERIRALPSVTVYGPEQRGSVVAFNMDGVHPHDLASFLDEEGIAVRAGHHCAQPLHDLLGVAATTRASLYLYNTETEVDALVNSLEKASRILAA